MGFDDSLGHAEMWMCDLMLGLRTLGGDHRCNELLNILQESVTYFSGVCLST